MALIEQLMVTELVVASPTGTVLQAAMQMDQNGVGAVLVVEGSGADAKLCGLFSERDLLSRVVVAGLDPKMTAVGSVMTKDPIHVKPGTHLRECAELIRDRGFRHLPVVQDGTPVGILSARDFHAHVVRSLESLLDQARYKAALEGGDDLYDHRGGSYGK